MFQFLSCLSHICLDMTGTLSSAVLNVTTRLSTPGRSLLRWRRSGATRACASYERSDLCQEKKERKQYRQLDFAAKKTEPQREFVCSSVCKTLSSKGPPSSYWMVNPPTQRFSFAVVRLHLRQKEASKEPITTCMTLFGGVCCCRYLWDYFFSLSSKCNIFLLIIRKHWRRKKKKDGVDLDSSCCYTPYDFGLHQTVNIHVASHLTLMIVTVH